jgi:DNA-binding HxlR family transcriptional regulator
LTLEIKRRKPFSLVEDDDFALTKTSMVLFHPDRMIIMKALFYHGAVEFRQLKNNIPGITDGRLASHLKALERRNFIEVHKEVIDRKLRTSYEITEDGWKAFKAFKAALKAFLKIGGSCYE